MVIAATAIFDLVDSLHFSHFRQKVFLSLTSLVEETAYIPGAKTMIMECGLYGCILVEHSEECSQYVIRFSKTVIQATPEMTVNTASAHVVF